ncbi:MAG TPA: formyltransferase family protein [Myxococcota bacterium]
MRIAYFGFDLFAECLARATAEHTVTDVFTFDVDGVFDFNSSIIAEAKRVKARVHTKPATPDQVAALDVDVIVAAGYAHKIPMPATLKGINVHPTLLPLGRGRWPLPRVLLSDREAAGVTIHKLVHKWDAGDILAQEKIALGDDDDLETLTMKLKRAAPDMLSHVLRSLDRAWDNARPQSASAYWPMPKYEDRLLDFKQPVADVLRVVRAFSKFESAAEIEGVIYGVTRANGWVEEHAFAPGTKVIESSRELLIAAKDGFVVLQEWKRA